MYISFNRLSLNLSLRSFFHTKWYLFKCDSTFYIRNLISLIRASVSCSSLPLYMVGRRNSLLCAWLVSGWIVIHIFSTHSHCLSIVNKFWVAVLLVVSKPVHISKRAFPRMQGKPNGAVCSNARWKFLAFALVWNGLCIPEGSWVPDSPSAGSQYSQPKSRWTNSSWLSHKNYCTK